MQNTQRYGIYYQKYINQKLFNMNTTNFISLNFVQRQGGVNSGLDKNTISVSYRKNYKSVNLGTLLGKENKNFKFLDVQRDNDTNEDYLVFNNEKGLNIIHQKNNSSRVSCIEFVKYLKQKYGKNDYFKLEISNNISNSKERNIYRIIKVKD